MLQKKKCYLSWVLRDELKLCGLGGRIRAPQRCPHPKPINMLPYLVIRTLQMWLNSGKMRGTWVAQSVKHLPLAQHMILGSLDPALCWAPCSVGSLLLPHPLPLPRSYSLFHALSQINTILKKFQGRWKDYRLSRWTRSNYKHLYIKGKQQCLRQRRCDNRSRGWSDMAIS